MTNEEAQELIAEIKDKASTYGGNFVDPVDAWLWRYKDLVQIITRFANKPPEAGYLSTVRLLSTHDEWFDTEIVLNQSKNLKAGNFYLESHGEEMYFTTEQLKQLRDNCTKMLEWLENE